jgi:hypothetical protein
MGFRTWNQFGILVNQTLMEQIYDALADKSRQVDGKPTSLLELGYNHAGIDDGWQKCNSGEGKLARPVRYESLTLQNLQEVKASTTQVATRWSTQLPFQICSQ